MPERARVLALLALACVGPLACSAGAGAGAGDGCPGGSAEDRWLREHVGQGQFAVSLCIPPGYRGDGAGTWRRPSEAAAIVVKPTLSGPEELDWPCGLECPPIQRTSVDLRLAHGRVAVLETGLMTPLGHRRVNVALLRIEVGPGLWLILRGTHPDQRGLADLVRALESVRLERVGPREQ